MIRSMSIWEMPEELVTSLLGVILMDRNGEIAFSKETMNELPTPADIVVTLNEETEQLKLEVIYEGTN